jgi:integrase/recombinase XerD
MIDLREGLQKFLLYLEKRGCSPRTRKTYGNDLMQFVVWMENQKAECTSANLERYQLHLMLRPGVKGRLTAETRNRHLSELRSFFRYLKKSGQILQNPTTELVNTKERQRLPKAILTVEEVDALLALPDDSPLGLRDRAALEVLYGTGIRRIEFTRLQLSDLRLGEGVARIWGKGNKERLVPLGEMAVQALHGYLKEARGQLQKGPRHSSVFVSGVHGGPLSDQEMSRVLHGYQKRAGIEKPVAFHIFRHSVATHLLQRGADLRSIQALLGHAKLDTTAIYTRVDITDLKRTLKNCHPREQDPPPDATF